MRTLINVTTNDTTPLHKVVRTAQPLTYGVSIFVQGDFDGATVELQVSPDGGTTFYTLKDVNGNDCITTSRAYFNVVLGNGKEAADAPQIYVKTSSGGAGLNLNIYAFDVS